MIFILNWRCPNDESKTVAKFPFPCVSLVKTFSMLSFAHTHVHCIEKIQKVRHALGEIDSNTRADSLYCTLRSVRSFRILFITNFLNGFVLFFHGFHDCECRLWLCDVLVIRTEHILR